MSEELPPDWAIEEALKRSDFDARPDDVAYIRRASHRWCNAIRELARMIAKHEQPPVDPDLVKAREIVADNFLRRGFADSSQEILLGEHDDWEEVKCTLAGIKWGKAHA